MPTAEDEDSVTLRNVGNHIPVETA